MPEQIKTGPSFQNNRSKQTSGFSLIELLVVLSIIAIMVALLMPAVRTGRSAARRSVCKNNLKQIALALHNYHEMYKAFPPAYTVDAEGNRLHSWRTLILPYLDCQDFYQRIDLSKPWNDPANANAFNRSVPVYQCPNAGVDFPENFTTYLAIVTPESCLRPKKSASLSEMTDGPEHTLMVMEVHSEQAVHWMSPMDASEKQLLNFSPKKKLPHEGGVHFLFADGWVRFVSAETSASNRRAMISIAGNDEVGEIAY